MIFTNRALGIMRILAGGELPIDPSSIPPDSETPIPDPLTEAVEDAEASDIADGEGLDRRP